MVRGGFVATLSFGWMLACSDAPSGDPVAAAVPPAAKPVQSRPAGSRWGGSVPRRAPALEALELGRSPDQVPVDGDARTAWTRARIGGFAALEPLAAMLDGGSGASAAHLAALALLEAPPGEPTGRWSELEDAVWTRFAVTEDTHEAEALLLAIARLGGARSQDRLATWLDGHDGADAASALDAIGMLCARDVPATASGLSAIASQLARASNVEAATYAVSRCAGPSAELLAGPVRGELVERLTPLLGTGEPSRARITWKALAALGEVPAEVPLNIVGVSPPPWMVEVEAVRALAAHADGRSMLAKRLGKTSPDMFVGPRMHVLIVALQGLRDAVVGVPEILRDLSALRIALGKAMRESKSDRRRHKALALASCESELLASIGSGDTSALYTCAEGVPTLPEGFSEGLEIEALLRVGGAMTMADKTQRLLERAQDRRPAVAAAALAALVDLDAPSVPGVLKDALAREDVGVRAAAVAALATRARDRARRDETAVPLLERAVTTWPNATAIEARIAAIEALGNLARSGNKDAAGAPVAPWLQTTVRALASDPAAAIRRGAARALEPTSDLRAAFELASTQPHASPFDAALQQRLDAHGDALGLRMTTDAGTIVIDFSGPAPWNQAVVASLAADGFYDGLTFHRVVPGFVVQGGDPRGDGYGGPGFLVPCEWSNRKVERGVVGMALAGKDTGGSQFFIAQAREPRLDARYTVLGQVREGLDVLDALLPHDRILKVEVLGR